MNFFLIFIINFIFIIKYSDQKPLGNLIIKMILHKTRCSPKMKLKCNFSSQMS